MAKVLIGYSACPLTRKAFEAQGHDVWTCDVLPARDGAANHLQCDIWEAANRQWDFAIFHPMCTYLTCSSSWALQEPNFKKYPGVGYHQRAKPETLLGADRRAAQADAVANFKRLMALPYPKAIENPAPSSLNTLVTRPSQVIHPHQYGDDASKGTGLWLSEGVPLLQPTKHIAPRWANQTDSGQNNLTPGDSRWLDRSATYPGIAAAFGDQWGRWLNEKPRT